LNFPLVRPLVELFSNLKVSLFTFAILRRFSDFLFLKLIPLKLFGELFHSIDIVFSIPPAA